MKFELDRVNGLLPLFETHENLWCYRRFLIRYWIFNSNNIDNRLSLTKASIQDSFRTKNGTIRTILDLELHLYKTKWKISTVIFAQRYILWMVYQLYLYCIQKKWNIPKSMQEFIQAEFIQNINTTALFPWTTQLFTLESNEMDHSLE